MMWLADLGTLYTLNNEVKCAAAGNSKAGDISSLRAGNPTCIFPSFRSFTAGRGCAKSDGGGEVTFTRASIAP